MRKRSVIDWLHVLGNIGLVAGLVLVAVQIRDSNRIASAEMFSASVDTVVSVNLAQLGETPQLSMTRVLYEPSTATLEDLYVADRVYDALFRALVRVHVFDQLALYGGDEMNPQGFIRAHYQAFACPYGLAWLDRALAEFRSGSASAEEQDLYKSLEAFRRLANANPASDAMAERQAGAEEIIAKLSALDG